MRKQKPPPDVFINCPFDSDYAAIFEALLFTTYACGFRPRTAREVDDASQTRIDKLYGIIADCRFSVHDLSRTELDPVYGLPRFNMPLELGIFLGAKRFGDDRQAQKQCLILDVESYRYQRFISDIAGMDIQEHGGTPRRAITRLRNWLVTATRRSNVAGGPKLAGAYERFQRDKAGIAAASGFDADDIPYVDFGIMVTTWLAESPS